MPNNSKGFTLIEVLIALGIAGVVLTAAYSISMVQHNSYKRQEQVTEMQQNLRAAMTFMTREIRMAGANPLSVSGFTPIETATADTFHFTLDISGGENDGIDNDDDGYIDGDDPEGEENYPDGNINGPGPNEDITYKYTDSDSNGIPYSLDRDTGGGAQPLAENIDAFNLVYLDNDGNPTTTISEIKAVQITIVARTRRAFPNYTDNTVYQNLQGETILDKSTDPDGYRRRVASSVVACRNL